MLRQFQKSDVLVGLVITGLILYVAFILKVWAEPGVGYDLWIELSGGAGLVVVSWLLLQKVKDDRKDALRKLLRSHGFSLLGWIQCISGIIDNEWSKNGEVTSQGLRIEAATGEVKRWMYVGFIRTIIRANENAKRLIEINDTISSDTILRLPPSAIVRLYDLTQKTYDFTGNFEYMVTRLAHRDFLSEGYSPFDPNKAAQVIVSLIKDIEDFKINDHLHELLIEFIDVLVLLGEDKKSVDELLRELTLTMLIDDLGIPQVRNNLEDIKSSMAYYAESPLLDASLYPDARALTKALREHRRKFSGEKGVGLERLFAR
ncbi:MAG: hypothetical protein RIE56_11045 [Amphiplicatus sp.]